MRPPELTSDLIDELDAFLSSDQTPDDCMQLCDLDGFLTGIVVSPELIMPSEWEPVIWRGEPPDYKDLQQVQHITGIIMARYNEIIHMLMDEPGVFEPILYQTPDGAVLADDWAAGFMEAFTLRVDAWDPILADDDGRLLMTPIMAQLYDKDGEPFLDGTLAEVQDIRDECAQSLPYAIKGIYDFWKARRKPASAAKTTKRKIAGRNEPCPCGSGRKYKRCCGAN
jgi:uncharacterized protein